MKLTALTKIGLLIVSLVFVFSSCTKEYYDEYYDIDWDITYKTVNSSDWKWNYNQATNTGFYSATIQMPPFTQALVLDGGIIVAQDLGNDVYRPLPYTIYELGDDGNTYGITVDYEYEPNYITFYYTYSDLYDGTPPAIKFKITSFY